MKQFCLLIVALAGAVLLSVSEDFPDWGDPNSPASLHVSPYYLEHSMEDSGVPNVVSSLLADYRGFDTMLETGVVFTAGMALLALLRRKRTEDEFIHYDDPVPSSVIVATTCRLIVPVIQLFGLYVLAHGHHSPGGGFQGGVILGSTFILYALSFGLEGGLSRLPERVGIVFSNFGVLIYAGIGLSCVLAGAHFLDYGVLSSWIGLTPAETRSFGILGVEIGVAFTVMAVMFSIYADLSSAGHYEDGM